MCTVVGVLHSAMEYPTFIINGYAVQRATFPVFVNKIVPQGDVGYAAESYSRHGINVFISAKYWQNTLLLPNQIEFKCQNGYSADAMQQKRCVHQYAND